MPWPKKNKMAFIVDPNSGSLPLRSVEDESILQYILKNPTEPFNQVATKFNRSHSYVYNLFTKQEVKARYNFLLQKSADEAVISKSYIIKGLMHEHKTAQRASDRLKALELLGKTIALYTDRKEITGLPKRLIIRTENKTEEISPDVSSSND